VSLKATDRVYHVQHRGQKYGPFSQVELSARILTHDMLVWREGMADWTAIGSVEELRPYVRYVTNVHTTVPPPQVPAKGVATDPPPPPPFPTPPPAQPAPRDTAMMLGAFHVIVASLTLIAWPAVMLGFLQLADEFVPLGGLQKGALAWAGQLTFFALGLLLAVPLLIAGVGLRQNRTWAPHLAGLCGWAGIGIQACHLVFTMVSAVVPMLNTAAQDDVSGSSGRATRLIAIALASSIGGLLYDVLSLRSLGRHGLHWNDLRRSGISGTGGAGLP